MPLLLAWLWLLAALLPLLFLDRWVAQHLQGISRLIFRDPDAAGIVYALLVFPGLVVHEGSHWFMAGLLGVRVRRFSLFPQRQANGALQLGYVEIEKVDFVRAAFIGLAPMLVGVLLVLLIGDYWLDLDLVGAALAQGDLWLALRNLQILLRHADVWLGLYLLFAISCTMWPSASDRQAWPALAVLVSLLTAGMLYAGFGPLLATLTSPLTDATRATALAFSLTVGLNLSLIPFIWVVEQVVSHLTNLKIEY